MEIPNLQYLDSIYHFQAGGLKLLTPFIISSPETYLTDIYKVVQDSWIKGYYVRAKSHSCMFSDLTGAVSLDLV